MMELWGILRRAGVSRLAAGVGALVCGVALAVLWVWPAVASASASVTELTGGATRHLPAERHPHRREGPDRHVQARPLAAASGYVHVR
jgi:hypothetical protein